MQTHTQQARGVLVGGQQVAAQAVNEAPPPRPVYYPVPINPVYVSAPPVAVPVAAATIVAAPPKQPASTTADAGVVPPALNYAAVPAPVVSYAQPLAIAPL